MTNGHDGPVRHAGGAPDTCRLCKALSDAATRALLARRSAELKGVS